LHFLRGVGVPEEWIAFYQSTMMYPIQYHSCFISYSSKDEALARRLHADLQDQGVRCWFAPEDMKIGDKIRPRIDEAIHMQDKLLLLLSKHSIASTWVEDEVEAALEKEQRQQREVLFPVRLDESVMQTSQAWAAKLRRTRHIGDFTTWTNPQAYQIAFDRLLRDLKKTS
jgi:TIR domain